MVLREWYWFNDEGPLLYAPCSVRCRCDFDNRTEWVSKEEKERSNKVKIMRSWRRLEISISNPDFCFQPIRLLTIIEAWRGIYGMRVLPWDLLSTKLKPIERHFLYTQVGPLCMHESFLWLETPKRTFYDKSAHWGPYSQSAHFKRRLVARPTKSTENFSGTLSSSSALITRFVKRITVMSTSGVKVYVFDYIVGFYSTIIHSTNDTSFGTLLPLWRLVSGSVEGQFSDFFEKIAATNSKHGPFDVLLCTGNFFATDAASSSSLDDLVSGKVTGNKHYTLLMNVL